MFKGKRKKIIYLLLVIFFLINVVAAAFIFINIQTMKAPDTTIKIEVTEMDSEKAVVQTIIDVYNPNDFEIAFKNIKIITTIPNGDEVSRMLTEGGVISPNRNKIFTSFSYPMFNGQSPKQLQSKITGDIGLKLWFIEKTIPFSMNVITSVGDLLENLVSPEIDIDVSFGEITQKNIDFILDVKAYNPNTFNISLKNILIELKNESNEIVGNLSLPNSVISALESAHIIGNGTIAIEALNAKSINISMSGMAVTNMAGYNKSLDINIETKINAPDLGNLLASKVPTDAVIRGDYRVSPNGLVDDITLEAHNPNNIDFIAKDITVTICRIDKNSRREVASGKIENGVLKANNNTSLEGEVVIPYRKLFLPALGIGFIPDWLEVTIRANITIEGLNSYFWVGMVGYQDFHPFRQDRWISSPKTTTWD